jgi:hypothetical protein
MLTVILLWLSVSSVHAAGLSPAANTDMGCSTSGQGLVYDGSNITCQGPQRPSSTIGSLPTCNGASQGLMYFATDALTPVALATVVAGGAVKIGVTCNGTSWIVQ